MNTQVLPTKKTPTNAFRVRLKMLIDLLRKFKHLIRNQISQSRFASLLEQPTDHRLIEHDNFAIGSLPPEFDIQTYRAINQDLKHLADTALSDHYINHGRNEGRRANSIIDRNGFASLIKQTDFALEIGPFANPLLSGDLRHFADYLNQAGLVERAASIGIDPEKIPVIHHVLSEVSLSDINIDFDAVLSSHCIEHQPDLIRHFQDIEKLLKKRNGRYYLLIPDKRYCFDHQIAESTIAEVIEAHVQKRQIHTLRSVIEHRALTVENDPNLYWNKTSTNSKIAVDSQRIKAALEAWELSHGSYIDVHAWYFTPDTFEEIVRLLRELGYIHMQVERMYPSRFGSNEFWVILKM
jgi:SAM-dependent methyltransferase